MATLDLSTMTVVELRKLAKEKGVTLGAGISKAGIIDKLNLSMAEAAPAPAAEAAPVPEQKAESANPAAKSEPAQSSPQYRAAWQNPSPIRYNSKPAYQAPSAYPQRSISRPAAQEQSRPMMGTRPVGYTPRFGPAAEERSAAPRGENEHSKPAYGPGASAERRTAYGEAGRVGYDAPARSEAHDSPRSFDTSRSDEGQRYESKPYEGGYAPRSGYNQRAYPPYGSSSARREYNQDASAPTANELLAASDCVDGAGVLELHPDGYGFLRTEHLLPSSRDIYLSMAQIRRFGLRSGDHVSGKIRPQRDGDRYAAMLYITSINGSEPEGMSSRPYFDELTPIYANRRINLETSDDSPTDLRLMDLVAPLGFGQRGLLLCPHKTGKTKLLQHLANAVTRNHPDAHVMVLLIDVCPEDVTAFREQVRCQVIASTFDQPPENHLRLADLTMERAQRLAENKQDAVVIVDSLTRLAKCYTTAAAQQGRATPGMINPTSLMRAKKLFGAGRCLKEGGSLTVIGVMGIDSPNKADDTIVEEFKGTATMELVLDASLARAGITPAINLQASGTKRAELLQNERQQEGLKVLRSITSTTRSAAAIPQLKSMMEKAPTNDELLARIQEWVRMMDQSR